MNSPASQIDHTLLKADSAEKDIAQLCEEAVEFGFASVCIPPFYVAQASELLYGSDVMVGTVVGFPLGYQTTEVKAFEAGQAVGLGADEIDMVLNLAAARSGDFDQLGEDISQVVAAAGSATVKVIIECCLFDDRTKQRLAEIVASSGAGYVKTSTGFSTSGATVEDVALLAQTVSGRAQVKAAGGIRDLATFQEMVGAGASRIGTSSGVAIMQQWQVSMGLAT